MEGDGQGGSADPSSGEDAEQPAPADRDKAAPPPSEVGDTLENLESIGPRDVRKVQKLSQTPETEKKKLKNEDLSELIKLKRLYGRSILAIMAVQLIVVNGVFVLLASKGWHWTPPESVVEVWLTATFVQIVGVVVGITRSLFPSTDLETEDKAETK